jgi:hypothetical protein
MDEYVDRVLRRGGALKVNRAYMVAHVSPIISDQVLIPGIVCRSSSLN